MENTQKGFSQVSLISVNTTSFLSSPAYFPVYPGMTSAIDAIFQVSVPPYLQWTVLATILLFCFLIGRATQEKKITSTLNMINDVEAEKKRLTFVMSSLTSKRRWWVERKGIHLVQAIIGFLIGLSLSVWAFQFCGPLGMLLCLAIVVILIIRWAYLLYLEKQYENISRRLNQKALAKDSELQQIVSALGPSIITLLKARYDSELKHENEIKNNRDCQLAECRERKNTHSEIYESCLAFLREVKLTKWCDLCSSRQNIDAGEVRLAQTEQYLYSLKKTTEVHIKKTAQIEVGKTFVNSLLAVRTNLVSQVTKVCLKGCCVKFRKAVETARVKHLSRIPIN